jgi:hypothetical protein
VGGDPIWVVHAVEDTDEAAFEVGEESRSLTVQELHSKKTRKIFKLWIIHSIEH